MRSKSLTILKIFFLFVVSLGIFYILEFGPIWDNPGKLLEPVLLAGLTVVMFFQPILRRYVLILSISCLLLMAITSIFNWLDLSAIIGSFGFSLLMVVVFLYLPEIIKKGYVEKF